MSGGTAESAEPALWRLCGFNNGVICFPDGWPREECRRCQVCGWFPEVERRRKIQIRAKLKVRKGAKL